MSNKKKRWSKVYESSEEELVEFLEERNIQAERIIADEFDTKTDQTSDHVFTIWCAEGSLVLRQASANISLQPGDVVQVDAVTPYDLLAGITGYVCYVTD